MKIYREILKQNAPMEDEEILLSEIREFISSRKRRDMLTGERYYKAQNDILTRNRNVLGETTDAFGQKNIADNRLAHNFLKELTDQKVQYLLGKDFSIVTQSGKGELLHQTLRKACNFDRLMMGLAKDCINSGVGIAQAYYDEHGEMKFKKMRPNEIIPLWKDDTHENLDGVIRVFEVLGYEGKNKKANTFVEYWTSEGVKFYELEGDRLFAKGGRAHATIMQAGQCIGYNFDSIPFIFFKYNEEEMPLICSIKSLIDDYDNIASLDANAIEDQPNSILVVRNYDGTKLDEFRRNLAKYRAVKVTDDGGVEAINTPLNTEAANAHLERVRKDIYSFGRGVDTRSDTVRGAASGIALRHEYATLDMDCNQLERELYFGFDKLMKFIKLYVSNQLGESYMDEPMKIIFNRDIIINEQLAIDMCTNSQGIISQKTIVANHPWVENVEEELLRLEDDSQLENSRWRIN